MHDVKPAASGSLGVGGFRLPTAPPIYNRPSHPMSATTMRPSLLRTASLAALRTTRPAAALVRARPTPLLARPLSVSAVKMSNWPTKISKENPVSKTESELVVGGEDGLGCWAVRRVRWSDASADTDADAEARRRSAALGGARRVRSLTLLRRLALPPAAASGPNPLAHSPASSPTLRVVS